MKPKQLRIQAFGPYLEKIDIDFSSLLNEIFLITGSTGVGKTAILDAICFALYGQSTGGRRGWEEMRCKFAPDGKETFVEFTFELKGEIYRFTRGLKVHIKRGSKEKVLQSENHCCKQTSQGGWQVLESGADTRVTQYAIKLLHLTREQFSQVIVLPQGDFLKLLRAKSSEKTQILKTLFSTEMWQNVTTAAKEKENTLQSKAEGIFVSMNTLLQKENVETQEELERMIAQYSEQLEDGKRKSEYLAQEVQKEEAAFSEAAVLDKLFAQLDENELRMQKINQEKPLQQEKRRRLEKGSRLRAAHPYFQAAERSRTDFQSKKQAFSLAAAQLQKAQKDWEAAQTEFRKIPKLNDLADQSAQQAVGLEKSLETLQRLEKLRTEAEQIRRQTYTAREKEAAMKKQLAQEEDAIQKGEQFVEKWQESNDSLPKQQDTVRLLTDQKAAWERWETLQKEWDSQKTALQKAQMDENTQKMQLEVLRQQLSQAEQSFVEDTAAWMASRLQEGAPCPVCGAVHHPQPHDGVKTRQGGAAAQLKKLRADIAEAEKKEDGCRMELSRIQASASQKEQEWKEQQEIVRDLPPAQETVRLLEQAQARLKELKQDAAYLPKGQEKLKALRENRQEDQAKLEACRQELLRCESELAGKTSAIEELSRSLTETADTKTMQEEIKRLQTQTDQARRQIAAVQKAASDAQGELSAAQAMEQSARVSCKEAQDRWNQDNVRFIQALLETQLFLKGYSQGPTPEEAIEIAPEDFSDVPEDRELKSLQQQIQQFESDVRSLLESHAILCAQLEHRQRPELEAMQKNLESLRRQSKDQAESMGRLHQRYQTAGETAKKFKEYARRLEKVEREHARAQRLANLLSGKNPKKTTIQAYVQSIIFDKVIVSASRFFLDFSSGRYSLWRGEDVRGNGLKGLDLVVWDEQICSSAARQSLSSEQVSLALRSVETLSGGEQFLASLSLAFGLSDVVQRSAGGVWLDSIFIDEGFGSLDKETLDTAMRALGRIRQSGRTIGIISHVTELQQYIKPRIVVSVNRRDVDDASGSEKREILESTARVFAGGI